MHKNIRNMNYTMVTRELSETVESSLEWDLLCFRNRAKDKGDINEQLRVLNAITEDTQEAYFNWQAEVEAEAAEDPAEVLRRYGIVYDLTPSPERVKFEEEYREKLAEASKRLEYFFKVQ